jgi:hypothetical protein
MSRQSILASKTLPASTHERFIAAMNLFVSPQIVLSDKPGTTRLTPVRSIRQVCLDVRLDVVFSAKAFAAVGEETFELMVAGVRASDVTRHHVVGDIGLSDATTFDGTVVDVRAATPAVVFLR